MASRCRRSAGFEADPSELAQRSRQAQRFLNQRAYRYGFFSQRESAGCCSARLLQFNRQPIEVAKTLADLFKNFPSPLLISLYLVGSEHLSVASDEARRYAQLMRHQPQNVGPAVLGGTGAQSVHLAKNILALLSRSMGSVRTMGTTDDLTGSGAGPTLCSDREQ